MVYSNLTDMTVILQSEFHVDAQWTIPATFQFQNGIEIIVMNNAKINASGTMTFIRNSMLTIMEKGEVNADDVSFTNGAPAALRNWGTLRYKYHDSAFQVQHSTTKEP